MSFEEAIKSHVTCQGQESALCVCTAVYGLHSCWSSTSIQWEDSVPLWTILMFDFVAMMSGYYYHMHNNPNWHFYRPQPPHYFQGTESGTNPSTSVPAVEVGPTVTAENTQQNSSGEDELVMYNASIKVLNSNKKKDFTVYTLRSLLRIFWHQIHWERKYSINCRRECSF